MNDHQKEANILIYPKLKDGKITNLSEINRSILECNDTSSLTDYFFYIQDMLETPEISQKLNNQINKISEALEKQVEKQGINLEHTLRFDPLTNGEAIFYTTDANGFQKAVNKDFKTLLKQMETGHISFNDQTILDVYIESLEPKAKAGYLKPDEQLIYEQYQAIINVIREEHLEKENGMRLTKKPNNTAAYINIVVILEVVVLLGILIGVLVLVSR